MNQKAQKTLLVLLSFVSIISSSEVDARGFRFRSAPHIEAPRYSGFAGSTGSSLARSEGFASAFRASKFVPAEPAVKAENSVSYLEKTEDGFFYKSNYTKDIEHFNQTEFHRLDQKAVVELLKNNKGDLVIDESVFYSNGAPMIDLSGVKKIKIVRGLEQKVLFESHADFLPRSEPPPLLISKIDGCCLYGIPPHLAGIYKMSLQAKPFKSENVRVVSLVQDSATKSAIEKSRILRSAASSGSVPRSISDIESIFHANRGKTLVLIGHVEGNGFVMRGADGRVVMEVSIESIRAMAVRNRIDLIDLGCETAKVINQQALGLGVMTRFNTVQAVRSLEFAINNSRNYSDFLGRLTSSGLRMVVDNNFVKGIGLQGSIYSRLKDSTRIIWIKVASVFVTFGAAIQ